MRIAIIGGIGSGKSTVLQILKNKGYDVLSCDEVNNKLICDKEYLKRLNETFVGVVVNGKLDKKALSSIVFNSKSELDKLNAIAHPIIRDIVLKNSGGEKINFVEVPLLFESGMENDFDKILLVTASKDVRVARAVKRDNKTKDEIEAIIKNQIDSYQGKNIDYIIVNDGSIDGLVNKVENFICQLKKV